MKGQCELGAFSPGIYWKLNHIFHVAALQVIGPSMNKIYGCFSPVVPVVSVAWVAGWGYSTTCVCSPVAFFPWLSGKLLGKAESKAMVPR